MKTLIVMVVLGCLISSESKSIGSILTSPGALQGLSEFISSVKSLFGTGGDFAKKYGYSYNDIYNSQLMFQAVNSYTNGKQVEQDLKQEETLEKDIDQEKWYFSMIAAFTGISTASLVVLLLLQLKEALGNASSRTKNKIIKDYVRGQELRTIAERIQE